LKQACDEVDEVDRDVKARMVPFGGTDRPFVATRNWMALTFDEKDRIWTELWAEATNAPGEKAPFTKVIHAVEPALEPLVTGALQP
jgi:hypothetical protein